MFLCCRSHRVVGLTDALIKNQKVKSEGKDTHSPTYDLKKYVKIYLGLNTMDVKHKDRYKENIYHPTKVT